MWLRREVIKGRVAGSFKKELLPKVHTSRFGLICQTNGGQLLIYLSLRATV